MKKLLLSPEDEDLRQRARYRPERADKRGSCTIAEAWSVGNEELSRTVARRMGLDLTKFIDHKDGNRNNNRRDNLRSCDNRLNQGNARIRADNTSGFKGVGFYKPTGKWRARIRDHGVRRSLGYFDTKEEAADAYAAAAKEIFGEFARL